MRILHYFLGFHRFGGLNRYASDLAIAQKKAGEQVFALFPGGSLFPCKSPTIRYQGNHAGIPCYELLGGNPIPLLEGIRSPQMILEQKHRLSQKKLDSYCEEVKPDVLHVHTWMGFPQELLPELKKRGCKIVYTTHDYFGICPKVNFIDQTGELCKEFSNENCSKCNCNAPLERFLQIRNSNAVLACKSLIRAFMKLKGHARKTSPRALADTNSGNDLSSQKLEIKDYAALRTYYNSLWTQCDLLHFNSEVTAKVFHQYLPDLQGRIISITHAGITDQRERKTIKNPVQITFIGSSAPYKGLPFFLNVLSKLSISSEMWELNIWGCDGQSDRANIRYHGTYQSNQLSSVFRETDLLVVPSICFETFGFVVVEALSHGVPVLCSSTVGAKQTLSPEMVFHSAQDLEQKLLNFILHPEALEEINKTICNQAFDLSIDHHYSKILGLYQEIQPKQ